ncbi:MAG: AraC family transcriptional regulator [Bacteroidetes bacterium]|nr:AraC family transcriptional regulator [Bacteroidota bacterium]
MSEIASFSKYHFHRIFLSMVGETLFQFIQRLRLEKAAGLLAANPKLTIGEVAMDCGFSDQATFARAFRLNFGVSATIWRREIKGTKSNMSKTDRNFNQTVSNRDQMLPGSSLYFSSTNQTKTRRYNMKTPVVRIEELKQIPLAYVRHIGPYKGDSNLFGNLFNKLCSWAGPRGLLNFPETKSIVIYHDNPDITNEEQLRVSVCISVPENTTVDGEICKMYLQPGKYAMARCEISVTEFQEAWTWVCGEWLPTSGYLPDDAPCFELYHNDHNDHPEKKFILDICVPVKPL